MPRAFVDVGFMDGNVRTGQLDRFEPTMLDLPVQFERFGRMWLWPEQVAYVAFQHGPKDRLRVAKASLTERFRVHVAGGRTFTVDVEPGAITSPLGFRGRPVRASPYESIYFYAHGVYVREKDGPLGAMLVDSGVVGPESLLRGVEAQAADRGVPLGQLLVESGDADPAAIASAIALQARRKLRIGQILMDEGLVTEAAVARAVAEQARRKGRRLGEVLVDMGVVAERDLTAMLGKKFQLRVVDLESYRIDGRAAALVPRELIAKHRVMPLEVTPAILTVAIADPLAVEAIEALRSQVRRRVDEVLVIPSQLKRVVDEYLASCAGAEAPEPRFDELLSELQAAAEPEQEEEGAASVAPVESDGGVVRVVNRIVLDAFRGRASDIHIEPNGKQRDVSIRFRVDGECVAYHGVPATYRHQLVARIKIMAGLDIAERRKPQDGKIRLRVGEEDLELRVATLPSVNDNEDVVLRILASSKPLPLDKMGFNERNLREVRASIRQPYGIFLCVGPTGSGKTTTLHSALGDINTIDTKIWTAEDPVEITQAGLRQVQVSAKIGLTFASVMRAFLRADPDVIMVGEMRDRETASTAVEASLTGHLVLSTLHTNSAPETVTRLLDMGLDPFSFGDALLAIVAQRLARALCVKCREAARGTPEEFAALASAFDEESLSTLFNVRYGPDFLVWRARPSGCEACGKSGYKGRIGIHEVLVASDAVRALVARRAAVEAIREAACAGGMTTLLQDGAAKAIAGLTDMKQVLAVCK